MKNVNTWKQPKFSFVRKSHSVKITSFSFLLKTRELKRLTLSFLDGCLSQKAWEIINGDLISSSQLRFNNIYVIPLWGDYLVFLKKYFKTDYFIYSFFLYRLCALQSFLLIFYPFYQYSGGHKGTSTYKLYSHLVHSVFKIEIFTSGMALKHLVLWLNLHYWHKCQGKKEPCSRCYLLLLSKVQAYTTFCPKLGALWSTGFFFEEVFCQILI